MLEITIPATDLWDESNQEFISVKECTLKLEHSLVSISKWESKWHIPFLSKEPISEEANRDYIRFMTLNKNVDPNVYYCITPDIYNQIEKYMEDSMTATTFRKDQNRKINNEQVTAELIYYWMITLGIPIEFQKWHINKLLTLIRVCNVKNTPTKKRSKKEIANDYAAINAKRRKEWNTKG